jgi:hypothetical protein
LPFPTAFVVKNGSKMCFIFASSIPHPISLTDRRTEESDGGQEILWRLGIVRRRELNGDRTMLVADRLGGM